MYGPYIQQSTQNLRFHQSVEAVALNATSDISVNKAIQIDERKTMTAIMNNNMLDYEV